MSRLQEVATAAGVSKATVSRVINNVEYVSESAKNKVLDAMKKLNFNAQEMRRTNEGTQTIGLLLPFENTISNRHFGIDIVIGAEEKAIDKDYMILLGNIKGEKRHLISKMIERNVEGILLFSTDNQAEDLQLLELSGIPYVLIDQKVDKVHASIVRGDNMSGSITLMNHLFSLGHRNIAMITPSTHSTFQERIRGFQLSMMEQGLSISSDNLIKIEDNNSNRINEAMHLLLNRADRPTALYIGHSVLINDVIEAIQEHDLSIPEDISIVTFDDQYGSIPTSYYDFFTSVNQSGKMMGSMAIELLFQHIRNPEMQPQEIVLPGTLNLRRSTRQIGVVPDR